MHKVNSIEDLAIFTGKPVFDNQLFVGRPNIGNRERFWERLNDILDRRWLTNDGRYVQEFERKLENLLGVKHCIVTCNATIALEIVIRALGMEGEVIVPSFTFIATAHALQWQQITPVFCDIEADTHCIDPARIEKLITPRTTGIIGVHLWGRPCDIGALKEITERRGLKLLFDAAHAFGSFYKGKMIGNFGCAEVFSFHATKFVHTFEGGAIVTNDGRLAERLRLMKNFGFRGYDDVVSVGTNGKMSEISAVMGLTSLESMDEFIAANHANYLSYKKHCAGIPGIKLLSYDHLEKPNYQHIVVEVDESQAGIGRDTLVEILHAENVIARRYFYPGCHAMEPYKSLFPEARRRLPNTEAVAARVVSLPTGPTIGEQEIAVIGEIIRFAVGNAGEIKKRIQKR